MIDCIYNSQAAQATIVYKDGSTELVNNVTKAYINENTYVLQCYSESVILTLSDVVKIDMK
jgi:hypothetical protein